eukprot:918199-Pleurochrysis_carterae.AAC.1
MLWGFSAAATTAGGDDDDDDDDDGGDCARACLSTGLVLKVKSAGPLEIDASASWLATELQSHFENHAVLPRFALRVRDAFGAPPMLPGGKVRARPAR